jgi:hypothetical protein
VCFDEGRQGFCVGDIVGGVGVAGVEAVKEVQDELGIVDDDADITEGVSEVLDPLAILVDGYIAQGNGVKLMTQEVARGAFLAVKSLSMVTLSWRIV